MASIADFMARAKQAKASGGAYNYFDEIGTYLIKVNSITSGETRKKIGYVALEGLILWTNNQSSMRLCVGNMGHYYIGADNDMFDGNLKAMTMAVTGLSESEINALDAATYAVIGEDLMGEKQEGAGALVLVTVGERTSAGKGKIPKGDKYKVASLSFFAERGSSFEATDAGLRAIAPAA